MNAMYVTSSDIDPLPVLDGPKILTYFQVKILTGDSLQSYSIIVDFIRWKRQQQFKLIQNTA